MNQILKEKPTLSANIVSYLICLLPISLIAGSLIGNTVVLLICLIFLFDIIQQKKIYLLQDKNFYFLLIINLYIVLNSIFISQNQESIIKAVGFIRFIILALALSYYFDFYKERILKFWSFVFLIVSIDILIEFSFGKNILGFSSAYYGRIASFTGDELKIGGYYFGFILICLSFFYNKNQKIFLILALTFLLISLIIGERSNFLKIFIMYILFFLFFFKISFLKKFLVIVIMFVTSFIIINNIPIIKSKFTNQIFKEFIKAKEGNYSLNLDQIVLGNQHFSHYKVALLIFKENIIFGNGFKTFRFKSFEPQYSNKKFRVGSTHPHQTHFEILSELGLIGYLLIMSNLIYVILRKNESNKNSLIVFAKLFIIASLIPILPSGSFFTSFTATIFFVNYSFLMRPHTLR